VLPLHSFLLFLDIGGGELLVILLVVFLLFGPGKMTEMAKKIGKAVHDLKKATNDMTREIQNEAEAIKHVADDGDQKPNIPEAGPVESDSGETHAVNSDTSHDMTPNENQVVK
jgi:sec-independent protein translocase protein TatA